MIIKTIKWLVILTLVSVGSLAAYLFVDFSATETSDSAREQSNNKIVNDITQLNPIEVAEVIQPRSIEEIVDAVKNTTGNISIGGGRYSQGGQIAYPNSLHLDMRKYNQLIYLDEKAKLVTVQAGMRWRDLQQILDTKNLSVKIMQTYANFTIGGSLSVNVHGRYVGQGAIIHSVESFKIVLADGSVRFVNRELEPELFNSVIGGYGGLGVITEVTLQVVDNHKVKRQSELVYTNNYLNYFNQQIKDNSQVVFHNADIYPPSFIDMRAVSWIKTDDALTETARLISDSQEYTWQPKLAELVAEYHVFKWARQHLIEPLYYSANAVQYRNYQASFDVSELEPKSREQTTYALREYFVPVENFDSFTNKMRAVFKKHDVNVLNVSVRHAKADAESYLSWSPQEVFAFVVYYRQGTDKASKEAVRDWSRELIDAAISEGGRYYLPYQLHATAKQFYQAYPFARLYFNAKRKYDPTNKFTNMLLDKYD